MDDTDDKLHTAPADGELFIRPVDRQGRVLTDPFRIFENPDFARRMSENIRVPRDVCSGYVGIGANLVVDNARQVIANLLGGKPSPDWQVGSVSWGTFDEVARFSDLTLSPQADVGLGLAGGENEIPYALDAGGNPLYKKAISSVDFPSPYIVRFEVILEADEAIGVTIREMGLWTTNGNLVARKTMPALSKDNSFAISWLWRIRC